MEKISELTKKCFTRKRDILLFLCFTFLIVCLFSIFLVKNNQVNYYASWIDYFSLKGDTLPSNLFFGINGTGLFGFNVLLSPFYSDSYAPYYLSLIITLISLTILSFYFCFMVLFKKEKFSFSTILVLLILIPLITLNTSNFLSGPEVSISMFSLLLIFIYVYIYNKFYKYEISILKWVLLGLFVVLSTFFFGSLLSVIASIISIIYFIYYVIRYKDLNKKMIITNAILLFSILIYVFEYSIFGLGFNFQGSITNLFSCFLDVIKSFVLPFSSCFLGTAAESAILPTSIFYFLGIIMFLFEAGTLVFCFIKKKQKVYFCTSFIIGLSILYSFVFSLLNASKIEYTGFGNFSFISAISFISSIILFIDLIPSTQFIKRMNNSASILISNVLLAFIMVLSLFGYQNTYANTYYNKNEISYIDFMMSSTIDEIGVNGFGLSRLYMDPNETLDYIYNQRKNDLGIFKTLEVTNDFKTTGYRNGFNNEQPPFDIDTLWVESTMKTILKPTGEGIFNFGAYFINEQLGGNLKLWIDETLVVDTTIESNFYSYWAFNYTLNENFVIKTTYDKSAPNYTDDRDLGYVLVYLNFA